MVVWARSSKQIGQIWEHCMISWWSEGKSGDMDSGSMANLLIRRAPRGRKRRNMKIIHIDVTNTLTMILQLRNAVFYGRSRPTQTWWQYTIEFARRKRSNAVWICFRDSMVRELSSHTYLISHPLWNCFRRAAMLYGRSRPTHLPSARQTLCSVSMPLISLSFIPGVVKGAKVLCPRHTVHSASKRPLRWLSVVL